MEIDPVALCGIIGGTITATGGAVAAVIKILGKKKRVDERHPLVLQATLLEVPAVFELRINNLEKAGSVLESRMIDNAKLAADRYDSLNAMMNDFKTVLSTVGSDLKHLMEKK